MGELELRNLTIRYRRQTVVDDLSLTVSDGELVSLLGPSGAGKTTVLRVVAGLMEPISGQVLINGRPVNGVPSEKRDVVMVFQKPLLFPFMSVEQNVGFGLRMRGTGLQQTQRHIDDILALVRLEGLNRRRVQELSGGQQQRVSLARALILEPAILLLDEPLSNLDATLRQQMRELIQEIQAQTRITTLFVTHDQAEALMISHRVALMMDGRLRQAGSPRALFYRPADPEVAVFFGGANFIRGRWKAGEFSSELVSVPLPDYTGNGQVLKATIRPEDVVISTENDSPGVPGRVEKTRFEGTNTRIWVRCGRQRLTVLASEGGYRRNQAVRLHLPPEKVRVFPVAHERPAETQDATSPSRPGPSGKRGPS